MAPQGARRLDRSVFHQRSARRLAVQPGALDEPGVAARLLSRPWDAWLLTQPRTLRSGVRGRTDVASSLHRVYRHSIYGHRARDGVPVRGLQKIRRTWVR